MDSIDKEIERRKFEARKGNHISDGVMWCPSCGVEMVSMGHQTCRSCDKTLPMTREEFQKLHDENMRKSAENEERRKLFENVVERTDVEDVENEVEIEIETRKSAENEAEKKDSGDGENEVEIEIKTETPPPEKPKRKRR